MIQPKNHRQCQTSEPFHPAVPEMLLLNALTATIGTLVGVIFGGLLADHSQRKIWKQQNTEEWRGRQVEACLELIAAARKWRSYIMSAKARIELVENPTYGEPVPVFDETGSSLQAAAELSLAKVQLLVRDQEVQRSAADLVSALRRLGTIRAPLPPGNIPKEQSDHIQSLQQDFIRAVGSAV
ncbi:hypothetical protein [Actinocorallia sp. A-T 12471]|uniref:hypothetical protein n=1 Tax=Actinocorallia sp. A-T 12471 TaxID=3089813 RepID=UPI0029CFF2A9|nr:hypothetical protein [Actinocorallia sp. A-T 12471]MDX6739777.1 hypothetical protein [Actinocorallia sp. A-T 12471]